MATVEFRFDLKDTAWFTTNAAMILKDGEPAFHETTGQYKLGDGVTALSALPFLPSPTLQQVLTAGNSSTLGIDALHFCVGRNNPDRPIEVYSSTGLASMQAYSTKDTSYAGVYAQGDDPTLFAAISQLCSNFPTSGFYKPNASILGITGENAIILNVDSSGEITFVNGGSALNKEAMRIANGNNIGLSGSATTKLTNPTAYLHLASGLSTIKSAPLKFTSGTNLTTPETGAVEYDGSNLFFTPTGTTRRTISYLDQITFTTTHFHSVTGPFTNATHFFDKSFAGVSTVSGTIGRTYIPYNCTLTGYSLLTYVAGTLGSAENISYYVRVNNTTDITLITTGKVNAITNINNSSALSTNLSAGDYIEIKIISPVMVTAPTSVSRSATLFFVRR